mmetsp:Transcript_15686/g.47299  ORF Transcript_15686/g.47299 Transcript_15686/m.47299 type:complete len:130 (-) Transcript_15686:679-1068(-)
MPQFLPQMPSESAQPATHHSVVGGRKRSPQYTAASCVLVMLPGSAFLICRVGRPCPQHTTVWQGAEAAQLVRCLPQSQMPSESTRPTINHSAARGASVAVLYTAASSAPFMLKGAEVPCLSHLPASHAE